MCNTSFRTAKHRNIPVFQSGRVPGWLSLAAVPIRGATPRPLQQKQAVFAIAFAFESSGLLSWVLSSFPDAIHRSIYISAGLSNQWSPAFLSDIKQTMPITQRICEASDALLMIKEGCLIDYVKSWGDSLPKVNLKERITEIKNGLGCGLSEAYRIYQAEQTSQERFLEIGDKITLVNRKGNWELYLKHEGFWIRSARLATNLDSLCTESSMFHPISFYTLCT